MLQRHLIERPLQYILERGLRLPELSELPEVPIPNWLPVRLAVDFYETKETYTVIVDLPGLFRDDMKVYIEGRDLIISGERSSSQEETKEGHFHYAERRYGSFTRRILLPTDAGNAMSASYENGVLKITIPRETRNINRVFIPVS